MCENCFSATKIYRPWRILPQCYADLKIAIDQRPNDPAKLRRRRQLQRLVRGLSNLSLLKVSMTNLAAWALRRFLRDAHQDFLHLAEVGGFDQMVIEPSL